MTLRIRKFIVIGIIGVVFMAGNILVIANWMAAKGIPEKANWKLPYRYICHSHHRPADSAGNPRQN